MKTLEVHSFNTSSDLICADIFALFYFIYSRYLPHLVDQGMEDGEVPLYGDGDGHEDAGAEEDVVEGVEEVGEQVVMDLGHHSSDAGRISTVILKCSPHTLRDADDQEEEVANGEGDQQVVEVALEGSPGEDPDGEEVGEDAGGGQAHGQVALHHRAEAAQHRGLLLAAQRTLQLGRLVHLGRPGPFGGRAHPGAGAVAGVVVAGRVYHSTTATFVRGDESCLLLLCCPDLRYSGGAAALCEHGI